jgi:molybdopterin-containing oxidoreductase family membrane subunit
LTEIGIYVGTFGLFFTLFLLFTRVAPVIAIAEVKSILKTAGDQYIKANVEKIAAKANTEAVEETTH